MPNINTSLSLETAARSDPRDNRFIWSYYSNGQCYVEVVDCMEVGALTYEVNGESTEIVCTNLRTGENEVVGTIDGGATKKATFDLNRYLPADYLSDFMRKVEQNCGLRMYMARGNECLDPYNVSEFSVLDYYGEVLLGNYTRTEMRHKDKSAAAAILEGTTVTAFQMRQIGLLTSIATRAETAVSPLVDLTLCDKKSCGGQCADDSDGCQKWLATDATGQVHYTTDQYFSEALVPNLPNLNAGTVVGLCCLRGNLVLIEKDRTIVAPVGTGTAFHIADLDTILDGGTPTWSLIELDVDGNIIENQNDCHVAPDGFTLWTAGDSASFYEYNPTRGTVTPVPGVAGLTANFARLDILGEHIIAMADNDVLVRSHDGGRSFQVVEVIDPATGVATTGLAFTAGAILSENNWSVGTDDGRVLYTLDDGVSWYEQIIPDNTGTAINDIHFDANLVGFMTENGRAYKTYYGNCEPWLPLPESSDPLPANNGLNRILNCPDDPNVAVAVGENDAGAGLAFVFAAEYR